MKMPNKLPFITGLRGYAAFFVFLAHASIFFGNYKIPLLHQFIAQAHNGVSMFFVISAFTLSLSISRHKLFSFKKYIVRRLRRVLPLFYFVALISFLAGGTLLAGPYYRQMFHMKSYDISELLYNLSFLSLFNQRYMNTLVTGGWTVPLELFYYLLIPSIYFAAKKNIFSLILIMFIGTIMYLNPSFAFPIYIERFYLGQWSIEKFLLIYAIGILTFILLSQNVKLKLYSLDHFSKNFFIYFTSIVMLLIIYKSIPINEAIAIFCMISIMGVTFVYHFFIKGMIKLSTKREQISQYVSNGCLLLATVLAVYYIPTFKQAPELFFALAVCVIISCGMLNGGLIKIIFENSVILHLGKISYSLYLLHLPVINLVNLLPIQKSTYKLLLVSIISISLATITQKYIEAPFFKSAAYK